MEMKETVKKLLSLLGYYRMLRRVRQGTGLLILMYHELATDEECGSLRSTLRERVSRGQFEAHLESIRRHFRVMSVEQAVDEIINEGHLLEDTISLTFDDGYRSVYDIAYPLLREYGFPATVYLTTGWINNRMSLWWEEIADMIAECDLPDVPFSSIESILGIPIADSIAGRHGTSDKKQMLHGIIVSHLRDLGYSDVEAYTRELRAVFRCDTSQHLHPEPLSWEQIEEMAGNGVRFGAHTVSHLNLGHASTATIEKEIVESKREIENRIGAEVKGFAYPYGQDLDAYRRAEPILAANGFSHACTAVPGVNDADSNLLALLRETLPLTDSKSLLGRELMLDLAGQRG